jgi:prepilin-type N-terminal cleavage/methylation domain-containing protein
MRDGFTLIEMLVATGIFVLGFVAVYSLFLSGMRFRKLADDTTRTATLASTLLTELYLDSGGAPPAGTGPAAPQDYNGQGNPTTPETATASGPATPLYPYVGIPGTEYRFSNTTDLLGNAVASGGSPDPTSLSTALVTNVFVLCPGAEVATLGDLNTRIHLITPADAAYASYQAMTPAQQGTYLQNLMVAHGIAMSYTAVVIRQPHWLNQ